MACPMRIFVVTASAFVAFLALYLTFWTSDEDELDRDIKAEQEDDDVDQKQKKLSFMERLKTMSPREILLEGALFHRRFSAKNLVMIGVIHVVVLSVAYFAYDYTAFLDANDSIGEPNDLLVVDTADVTVPAT